MLIVLAGLGVVLNLATMQLTYPEEHAMATNCGDGNMRVVAFRLEQLWPGQLTIDDLSNAQCAKSPYSSDMFVLATIRDADLSGVSMSTSNEFGVWLMSGAANMFPGRLPAEEGATPRTASNFVDGGAAVSAIADYGSDGRFIYFQM